MKYPTREMKRRAEEIAKRFKSCPFCGSEMVFDYDFTIAPFEFPKKRNVWYSLYCQTDGCFGEYIDCAVDINDKEDVDKTVESFNRRRESNVE